MPVIAGNAPFEICNEITQFKQEPIDTKPWGLKGRHVENLIDVFVRQFCFVGTANLSRKTLEYRSSAWTHAPARGRRALCCSVCTLAGVRRAASVSTLLFHSLSCCGRLP